PGDGESARVRAGAGRTDPADLGVRVAQPPARRRPRVVVLRGARGSSPRADPADRPGAGETPASRDGERTLGMDAILEGRSEDEAPARVKPSAMTLRVRVKPNARSSSLEQLADGTWVAKLKSPPVDGRANEELIALVAERFRRPKAAVVIRAGASA